MTEPAALAAPQMINGMSTQAIIDAVQCSRFAARDIYNDGRGTAWIRASAVWLSRKRFFMNHSLAAFEEAAFAEPRLDVYRGEDDVTYLRVFPR